jgi:hypothetical protein
MSRNRFIIMIAASFILMLGVALVFFALMDAQFSRGASLGMLWLLPQGRTLYQNTQYFVHNGIVGFAMYNIIELAIGRLITTFLKESSGSKPKPPVKV